SFPEALNMCRLRSPLSLLLLGLVASCTGAIGDVGVGPGPGGSGSVGAGGGGGSKPIGVGGTDGSSPPSLILNGSPGFSRYVRLTHDQWENAVRDLLQLPALSGLSSTFTPDPPGSTFTNNESRLFMTSGLWSDYETAAETLSQQVAR